MRLKRLSYRENVSQDETNRWELHELALGERNLIVGKNATGKTRIINVIHGLAKVIQGAPLPVNAEWKASFADESGREIHFSIGCSNGKITHEEIGVDGDRKLERTPAQVRLYSYTRKEWQKISPPEDRLVLHVRRDRNEFPFLEDLTAWAEGVRGFRFGNTSPNLVEIPGRPFELTSLNAVPSALEALTPSQLQNVLKQLKEIGYFVDEASTGLAEGLPPTARIIFLKEQGIPRPLKQFELSQGMFRAFSLLTIIEYLRSSDAIGSILIDDLCEGLDFERSKKLAEVLFGKKTKSKIQLVATSNDAYLINAIPLNDLTLCYREQHVVNCMNYANSKGKFDEWKQLGLNNFDLFSSNFLLSQ